MAAAAAAIEAAAEVLEAVAVVIAEVMVQIQHAAPFHAYAPVVFQASFRLLAIQVEERTWLHHAEVA